MSWWLSMHFPLVNRKNVISSLWISSRVNNRPVNNEKRALLAAAVDVHLLRKGKNLTSKQYFMREKWLRWLWNHGWKIYVMFAVFLSCTIREGNERMVRFWARIWTVFTPFELHMLFCKLKVNILGLIKFFEQY